MDEGIRNTNGLMDVGQVAGYTRLSPSTIRKRVAAGTIPVVRIGRRTLFKRDEIDAWIERERERRAA